MTGLMDRAGATVVDDPAGENARRREPRLRTLLSGKLVFGQHSLTADCAIRNLSSGGAKLRTSLAASLPRDVWLIVIKRNLAYRCRLAWRRGEEVGVRFETEYDLTRDVSPDLSIVRRVWREVVDR